MKRVVCVAVFLLLFFLTAPVAAEEQAAEMYGQQYEASGAGNLKEELPDETKGILEGWGITPENPDSFSGLTPKKIWSDVWGLAAQTVTVPLGAGVSILVCILLCAVAGVLKEGGNFQGVTDYLGVLCVSCVILLPLFSSITKAVESIQICGGFMLAFVPVYAGILIAAGRTATAGGYQTMVFGAAQLVTQLASHVITPFCGGLTAMSVCASLAPGYRLDSLSATIKKVVVWLLGIAMTVFTGLLTITGAIHSAADSVGIRAAKFVVGSSVPFVGGAVSEALGSVQGCLGVLRSSVGGYGAIAMAILLLPVLIELLLWKLMLLGASSLCDMFGVGAVSQLINAMSSVLSIILAVLVCCAMMFLISMTVMMLMGGQT